MKPSSKPKGQSLVEFAILLPVLLLISIVVVDLGRAVYYYSAIHNAAREGVRYGIIYPDDPDGMRNTTIEYAFGLGLKDVEVIFADLGDPQIIDDICNPTVKVKVEYAFTPATPLVSNLLPGGIILKSEAVMRTETYPDSYTCP